MKIRYFLLLIVMMISNIMVSQTQQLKGTVYGSGDVEGIHIINKNSKTYATTNDLGIFEIEAKPLDTLTILSLKYKLKIVPITSEIIDKKELNVFLEESVNELDEVVIGNTLGNLEFDIKNSKAKRGLNFYDLGIPGYTGPKKTQLEKRVYDADHGKYVYYTGLSFAVNMNKLLNKISGRTKKLKEKVELEQKIKLKEKIEFGLSEAFFRGNILDPKYQKDFLYFCADQPDFLERCKDEDDIEIYQFLVDKLEIYKQQLASNKN